MVVATVSTDKRTVARLAPGNLIGLTIIWLPRAKIVSAKTVWWLKNAVLGSNVLLP